MKLPFVGSASRRFCFLDLLNLIQRNRAENRRSTFNSGCHTSFPTAAAESVTGSLLVQCIYHYGTLVKEKCSVPNPSISLGSLQVVGRGCGSGAG